MAPTESAVTPEGVLGTVAVLRRYPVKSMLGEDLRACEVTARGLAGDRVLGLVHRETGKVASAKNPRLWRGALRVGARSRAGGEDHLPGRFRRSQHRPRHRRGPVAVPRAYRDLDRYPSAGRDAGPGRPRAGLARRHR